MITSEEEYAVTQECAAQFAERVARLVARRDNDPWRATRLAAAQSQLAELQRELSMWDAGIREQVPSAPDLPPPPDPAAFEVLSAEENAIASLQAGIALKRAEIVNIDRQIALNEGRSADWRRHRAWLEREITGLEAELRQLRAGVMAGGR